MFFFFLPVVISRQPRWFAAQTKAQLEQVLEIVARLMNIDKLVPTSVAAILRVHRCLSCMCVFFFFLGSIKPSLWRASVGCGGFRTVVLFPTRPDSGVSTCSTATRAPCGSPPSRHLQVCCRCCCRNCVVLVSFMMIKRESEKKWEKRKQPNSF
jgi:hypothetical protein